MSKVGGYLAMPNTICSGHPTKSGRAEMAYRSDLSDAEWYLINVYFDPAANTEVELSIPKNHY